MAELSVLAGSTSQSINIFVRDSSSTTGGGLAGIAPAGGSLLSGTKLDYSFTGTNAARVNVTLSVLAAVNSAYSSGGIVQIDNTNMIGWVRIDLPDAAIASAKGRQVSFLLWGGTNMAPRAFSVELTAVNNQSATAFITGVNSLAPPTNWNLLSIDGSGRMDLAKWIGVAPLALSSQQVQAIVPDTQKVDVNTIKTQSVTLAGGITFPAATVASTTNITSAAGCVLSATGSAAMTEGYPADGATGTLNQLLYLILQNVQEFSISGTTLTVNKLDGSTTAATYTLDDASAPTSRTRAT